MKFGVGVLYNKSIEQAGVSRKSVRWRSYLFFFYLKASWNFQPHFPYFLTYIRQIFFREILHITSLIAALKAMLYSTYRPKWFSLYTVQMYCPIWMKCSIRGLHVMLLSVYGFLKSAQGRPRFPYERKRNYTYTCSPWHRTIFWSKERLVEISVLRHGLGPGVA